MPTEVKRREGENIMMIYSITLANLRSQKSDFEKLMLDEVFPAVDKSSLRTGQITGLVLLRGKNTGVNTNQYLWIVHGGINGGAARSEVAKIEAFGAQVSPMNEFVELGSWFAENESPNQGKPFG